MVQATGGVRVLAGRGVRAMGAVQALADGVEEAEVGGGVESVFKVSMRSRGARCMALGAWRQLHGASCTAPVALRPQKPRLSCCFSQPQESLRCREVARPVKI